MGRGRVWHEAEYQRKWAAWLQAEREQIEKERKIWEEEYERRKEERKKRSEDDWTEFKRDLAKLKEMLKNARN
jgi:uncharacterized protein (DUF2384 family)